MKKNNIGALITIILLLCICLPGAIYGTYIHFKTDELDGNINREFYYDGKLYFYDNTNLLGTYKCNHENCGYAKNSVVNQEFENFNSEETVIELINNKYAFIKDGENIVLYDIKSGSSIINYKEVKNYSLGINNTYYLVKNEADQWGMISVADNISVIIPNNYLYLGLTGILNDKNNYDASFLIAKTDNGWHLINNENSILASADNMIIKYSDKFIVTSENKVYDYNNKQILSNYNLTDIELLENLIIAIVDGRYVIYNNNTNSIIKTLTITNNGAYKFSIENNSLIIMQADRIIETIALN